MGSEKHEEGRGAGLILDEENSQSLKGCWAVSDSVLQVWLSGAPFNFAIIVVCAPASEPSLPAQKCQ